jgi:hypothetical protein
MSQENRICRNGRWIDRIDRVPGKERIDNERLAIGFNGKGGMAKPGDVHEMLPQPIPEVIRSVIAIEMPHQRL